MQIDLNNRIVTDLDSSVSFELNDIFLFVKEFKNLNQKLIDTLVLLAHLYNKEGIEIKGLNEFHFNKGILLLKDVRIKRVVKVGNGLIGEKGNICDVLGVKVGHYTYRENDFNTGLTVILPHDKEMFYNKVVSSCYAFNGFGKSAGLMQIEEMGTIETPIVMSSTLNVGKICDALVEYTLSHDSNIQSVNPIVLECNDGNLTNSQLRPMGYVEFINTLNNASDDFTQGDIGAGTGMVCHGLKGGIGSSSRIVKIGDKEYTIGIILNSNFGTSNGEELIFKGKRLGPSIKKYTEDYFEKGSIVAVLATDIPVNERQLKRMLKRIELGISRTGSYAGNGSGDVFIGFTTSNVINTKDFNNLESRVMDSSLNPIFKDLVDMVEEAVLNSMLLSHHVKGYRMEVNALMDYVSLFRDDLDLVVEYN